MKALCWIGFGLAMTLSGQAGSRTVAHYNWDLLSKEGKVLAGELVRDDLPAVKLTNTNNSPVRLEFLHIEKPLVQSQVYGIQGRVKYQGVEGDAYLEMWSEFPPANPGTPNKRFFSRTLADTGPLAKLTGNSEWRPFTLPFNRTGMGNAPSRMELALYLPGTGTVHIGPLALMEYPSVDAALTPSGAWWPERKAGLVGGFGGAVVGCLGGLLGWLVSRGRARHFVLGTTLALIAIGAICLVFGVAALALKQPFYVTYPLCLGGVLLVGILSFQLKRFYQHYQSLELRRMNSLDAMG